MEKEYGRNYGFIIDCSGELKVVKPDIISDNMYDMFVNLISKANIGIADNLPLPFDNHFDCYIDDGGKDLPENKKATEIFGRSINGNVLILHFDGIDDSELLTSNEVDYIKRLLTK